MDLPSSATTPQRRASLESRHCSIAPRLQVQFGITASWSKFRKTTPYQLTFGRRPADEFISQLELNGFDFDAVEEASDDHDDDTRMRLVEEVSVPPLCASVRSLVPNAYNPFVLSVLPRT